MIYKADQCKNTLNKIIMLILLSIFNSTDTVRNGNGNRFMRQQINILAWTSSDYPPLHDMANHRMQECKFNNCFVTKRKSFDNTTISLENFDVLLFDIIELSITNLQLPNHRTYEQKYIFVSREPPTLYPLSAKYNQVFNLTWTYKLDSDIKLRYLIIKDVRGKVIGPKNVVEWMDVRRMKPLSKKYQRKLEKKRLAAAWFVSHCNAPSGRLHYVKDLLKTELAKYHLKVDIFGQCGDQPECPRDSEHCHAMIESDYYFYLAFENSICEDYVTEKVLTATKHFSVPIVFGGADYTRFLPPGSYLDARALGPEKLAHIMNESIHNKKKYSDFFKWHRYYSLHDPSESPETDEICALCAFLNMERKIDFRTTVYDIANYFT